MSYIPWSFDAVDTIDASGASTKQLRVTFSDELVELFRTLTALSAAQWQQNAIAFETLVDPDEALEEVLS